MKSKTIQQYFLAFVLSVLLSPDGLSQVLPGNINYQPEIGQDGKDVVWVPTPHSLVEKMLNLAGVTPEDFLIDLGSGDGRTVIAAAKRGIHGIGIEYNPDMVELSKRNAAREGVSDRVDFIEADLFEYDFSKATVITMFLLPDINIKLQSKLLDMKPGTRVVSNTFTMDAWMWDETAKIPDSTTNWNTAFLWIIPAKVSGIWKLPQGELILTQEFQMLSGRIITNGKSTDILEGRLRGNEISFRAGKEIYSGTVDGDNMAGSVKTEKESVYWNASR